MADLTAQWVQPCVAHPLGKIGSLGGQKGLAWNRLSRDLERLACFSRSSNHSGVK